MSNPLYQEVYLQLKKLIRDGEYEMGSFLPTEDELQAIYNVSRTTVRNAVAVLIKEGYVESSRGRGTQVRDFRYTQDLSYVTSTSETLRQKGFDVTTKSIFIDIVQANERRAKTLGLEPGADIYRIQRVQLADKVPIAIMENYLDVKTAPGLERLVSESFSLYNTLEKEYGLHIDAARDVIGAKTADFTESQLLDVKVGAALLVIRRVALSGGKPRTYDKTTLRGDRYQFEAVAAGRKYS